MAPWTTLEPTFHEYRAESTTLDHHRKHNDGPDPFITMEHIMNALSTRHAPRPTFALVTTMLSVSLMSPAEGGAAAPPNGPAPSTAEAPNSSGPLRIRVAPEVNDADLFLDCFRAGFEEVELAGEAEECGWPELWALRGGQGALGVFGQRHAA